MKSLLPVSLPVPKHPSRPGETWNSVQGFGWQWRQANPSSTGYRSACAVTVVMADRCVYSPGHMAESSAQPPPGSRQVAPSVWPAGWAVRPVNRADAPG